MPLYDYQCFDCGHEFAKNLTISERKAPEHKECPACGALKVQQVILSAPALGDAIRLGVTRPDGGMREVLQKVHEKTPGSRLKDVSNLTRL